MYTKSRDFNAMILIAHNYKMYPSIGYQDQPLNSKVSQISSVKMLSSCLDEAYKTEEKIVPLFLLIFFPVFSPDF